MDCTLNCPDATALEELALGRMDPEEVERLAEHCERCERCVEALQRMRAEDALVETMRSRATASHSPVPDKVQDLMQRLRALYVPDDTPDRYETAAGHCPPPSNPASADSQCAEEHYDFLAPPEAPGELGRLGDYRVLRVLGAGGMGIVFLAEEPELKRRVALKVMKPVLAASASARQRFLREARAMAAVQNDHVIHINHIGQAGDIPLLAMPYLEGETLEDRLRREGRLSAPEVVRIGGEIAEGLAAAHKRGLIHRDVKPANIWLEGERSRVKILDFGLARAAADDANLTQPGAIAGTPAYMAPEQVQGGAIDNRSDLFGLGCVLYHLCTGESPFKGNGALQILRSVECDQPKAPHEVSPDVPPALSAFIMQLLAKKPEERPKSAEEVIKAIREVTDTTPDEARQGRSTRIPGRQIALVTAALLLALLPLVYFFAGTVIRFVTNKGELVIETEDPNVEVTIRGDKAIIYDKVKDRRFVLTAGEYEVEVREEGDGGVRFATKKFTITRGGKETFHARLERAGTAKTDAGAGAPDRQAAEWVLKNGGTLEVTADAFRSSAQALVELPNRPFHIVSVSLREKKHLTGGDLGSLRGLMKLESLDLSHSGVTSDGLAALQNLPRLKELILFGCPVSDEGLRHLKAFPGLERLDLWNAPITDGGLVHLKHLPNLRSLQLSYTRITDSGLRRLAELATLESLTFAPTAGVTNGGLEHLQALPALHSLTLGHSDRLGDRTLEVVKGMKGLRRLTLWELPITDEGMKHLTGMTRLTDLQITNAPITDDGLGHLTGLKELRNLSVPKTRITEDGIRKLKQALPDCTIVR